MFDQAKLTKHEERIEQYAEQGHDKITPVFRSVGDKLIGKY